MQNSSTDVFEIILQKLLYELWPRDAQGFLIPPNTLEGNRLIEFLDLVEEIKAMVPNDYYDTLGLWLNDLVAEWQSWTKDPPAARNRDPWQDAVAKGKQDLANGTHADRSLLSSIVKLWPH